VYCRICVLQCDVTLQCVLQCIMTVCVAVRRNCVCGSASLLCVLQCVVTVCRYCVCCSVSLLCVLQCVVTLHPMQYAAARCSLLPCVALCCSVRSIQRVLRVSFVFFLQHLIGFSKSADLFLQKRPTQIVPLKYT